MKKVNVPWLLGVAAALWYFVFVGVIMLTAFLADEIVFTEAINSASIISVAASAMFIVVAGAITILKPAPRDPEKIRFNFANIYLRMMNYYGSHVTWPTICPVKPYPWQLALVKEERALCKLLGISFISDGMRARYWEQVRAGQGYTDAMGYQQRKWKAALRLPYLPADVSYSAISHDPELCKKYGERPIK